MIFGFFFFVFIFCDKQETIKFDYLEFQLILKSNRNRRMCL